MAKADDAGIGIENPARYRRKEDFRRVADKGYQADSRAGQVRRGLVFLEQREVDAAQCEDGEERHEQVQVDDMEGGYVNRRNTEHRP